MTHLANLTIDGTTPSATHTDYPKLLRGTDFPTEVWDKFKENLALYGFNSGSTLPTGLSAENGSFAVSGGVLTLTGSAPSAPGWVACETTGSGADVSVTAIVRLGTDSNNGGLVARFSNTSNFWHLALDGGGNELRLRKRVSGSWTNVQDYTVVVEDGVDYHLELRCDGSSIEGYLDGVLRVSTTDSFNSTETKCGVRASADHFTYDDLIIGPAGYKAGRDIRLYLSDGTTEIAREVVSCDPISETAEMYCLIPTVTSGLSGTDDTVIQIHGDGTSDDYAVTATYGRNAVWADYEIATHDGGQTDSTGNHTFESVGSPGYGDGPIGTALIGGTSSNHNRTTDGIGTFSNPFTIQGWIRSGDGSGSNKRHITIADSTSTNSSRQAGIQGGNFFFSGQNAGNTDATWLTDWVLSHGVQSATNNRVHYLDGVAGTTNTTNDTTTTFNRFALGASADSTPFGTDVDVAGGRLRYSALSSDWTADEYSDQSGNSLWHDIAAVSAGPTYTLSLDAGSFALSGGDLSLLTNRVISLDAGVFTLTGGDLNTPVSRVLNLESGTFIITGGSVDFVYTPNSGPTYTMSLDAGTFTLTGGNNNLLVNRSMLLEAGSFTISGGDLSLLKAYVLDLEAGTFLITGGDINPQYQRVMTLEAGDFTLTGGNVNFTYSGSAKIATVIGIPVADIASIY